MDLIKIGFRLDSSDSWLGPVAALVNTVIGPNFRFHKMLGCLWSYLICKDKKEVTKFFCNKLKRKELRPWHIWTVNTFLMRRTLVISFCNNVTSGYNFHSMRYQFIIIRTLRETHIRLITFINKENPVAYMYSDNDLVLMMLNLGNKFIT
jgi:hypothetical protein